MQLTAVGKRYGRGPWLWRGIDLTVAAGDVVAVSGPNGSGKSTLLDILAGVSRPTTGTVADRPATIGYVPERFPAIHQGMSAIAYLRHLGRIRGLTTTAATDRATELLDRFELSGGSDAPIRRLSKGNAQRVALAQALLVPPALLILDEPGTGLDELGWTIINDVIDDRAERGGAVVLSSPTGDRLSDRAIPHHLSQAGLRRDTQRPPDSDPRRVLIVLRRPPQAQDLPARSARFVVAPSPDGLVRLVADRSQADRILTEVLRCGWSVHRVEEFSTQAAGPDQAAIADIGNPNPPPVARRTGAGDPG